MDSYKSVGNGRCSSTSIRANPVQTPEKRTPDAIFFASTAGAPHETTEPFAARDGNKPFAQFAQNGSADSEETARTYDDEGESQ
jgi:hypothetical protein